MSTGIWAAASGAVSQMTALDVAANNVANASTPGFRADRALFRQELNRVNNNAAGSRSLRFAITRTVEPDRKQGQLLFTGKPTDVAIKDADSLFVVKTPNGERYTRCGSIQITADGTLRTPDGHAYLGTNRTVVKARPDAKSVSISNDGSVVVDGIETGQQLSLVKFRNSAGLVKEGDVLFKATPDAGRASLSTATLESSALETSNASALTGMTSIVQASREFEMLTKVIEAFNQVETRVAQSIAQK